MSSTNDRMHIYLRRGWIAAAVLIVIAALGVGADRATGEMCGACHEIDAQVASHAESPHSQLACPDCHEPARAWYRFPETLAQRAVMLSRNLGPHLEAQRSGTDPLADVSATIEDYTCRQCHDPSREVTVRADGTILDHEEHIRLNDSCVSCHGGTTHPAPGTDPSLLFMSACFDCHGKSETPEASGACDVCHPESFELSPVSHQESGWESGHGGLAIEDRDLCLMCHEEQVCSTCHGLEMPHPEGWDDGSVAHGPASEQDRLACANCHADERDFCTSCHHDGFSAPKGSWVDQHAIDVKRRGGDYCLQCHEPSVCVDCHTAAASESS